jgi:hypothetical protein
MIRISIAVILAGLVVNVACAQPVVVTPEETDEILANPGMGWMIRRRLLPISISSAVWGTVTMVPKAGGRGFVIFPKSSGRRCRTFRLYL